MKKVSTILVISALLACQSFADATSDFCVQVKSTMNKGAKGVNVLYLQKKLVAEGLLTDKARTNFDTDTFNAVKSFQKKNGLAQVGNVGPGTLAKMRSLWCSTSPTSASKPTGSNSNVEVLQDYVVTFIGERMINIKTDKICNLPNGGSIDWGDGQVNVLGPRISEDYKCKTEGFFHELNSVDNNITVLDDTGKARYKINVKISKPVQDNVYIEDFTAQKFYSNKYQFKWSTGNAVKCIITDNKHI
jgi:peptidoglycan hydrolase-like protein with peptidoglycan-binding domain